MQRVAIVFGSPRKGSNTEILVKEAQRGLADAGASSEIFYLQEMNIAYCKACYHCKKANTTTCALKDDMQKIHRALEDSEGLIVATPIYFAGVTAQTKTWVDRMFPYIDMKLNSRMPKGKKASLIFTQNQPDPDRFLPAIKIFRSVIKIFGYEMKETLLACNLEKGSKPMVTEDKEMMQRAYQLGRHLLD